MLITLVRVIVPNTRKETYIQYRNIICTYSYCLLGCGIIYPAYRCVEVWAEGRRQAARRGAENFEYCLMNFNKTLHHISHEGVRS